MARGKHTEIKKRERENIRRFCEYIFKNRAKEKCETQVNLLILNNICGKCIITEELQFPLQIQRT